jgi:hypothetical protein
VTPTLSHDEIHVTVILEVVVPDAIGNWGAVGAVVSGQAAVDPESDTFPERFPFASTASTAIW